ncbi:hypothetical protein GOODEAATRI_030494 [Goodea atripinnis]|uniref:Uncharacterized protein n=1 Tax=Goodea atripinnis TaxID=208336 RepID=A0ABV0N5M3_9TELE
MNDNDKQFVLDNHLYDTTDMIVFGGFVFIFFFRRRNHFYNDMAPNDIMGCSPSKGGDPAWCPKNQPSTLKYFGITGRPCLETNNIIMHRCEVLLNIQNQTIRHNWREPGVDSAN